MSTARRLIVLGAGGHGRAVADVAQAAGWTVAGFTDLPGVTTPAGGPPILGRDADLADLATRHAAGYAVVGVGNTALTRRAELFATLTAACRPAPAIVHPRASIATSATLAPGTVVFPNVVLGAHVSVGDNAVLYSGAIVEHDSRIGAHAYLSPGVIVCGGVTIEDGAFIGAGAVLVPGAHVGRGAAIGAQSLIRGAIGAGLTVSSAQARP